MLSPDCVVYVEIVPSNGQIPLIHVTSKKRIELQFFLKQDKHKYHKYVFILMLINSEHCDLLYNFRDNTIN